jgi:hypothetical protein
MRQERVCMCVRCEDMNVADVESAFPSTTQTTLVLLAPLVST